MLLTSPISFYRVLCAAAMAFSGGAAHADFIGNLGSISAPASLPFSNATASNLAVGTVNNFQDQWNFTLAGGANFSSLVAAFKFSDPSGQIPTFGISNLQVNLLDASLFTLVTGWTSVTTNSPFTQTVSITPATGLAAGNYTLQVRGTIDAPPAAYSGSLIAATPSPVPLPAAMPLLLLGLAVLRRAGRWSR
jgi:hypothetical protein